MDRIDHVNIICVSYVSDILFFGKFYHIAFTFFDKVYHFIPKIEGGFNITTIEEFKTNYPNQIRSFESKDSKINYFGKIFTVNSIDEIKTRIEYVKKSYETGEIKYTAFSINCEYVTIFILNSDIKSLNINKRIVSPQLCEFLGKSATIESILPFFKDAYNTICFFPIQNNDKQHYNSEGNMLSKDDYEFFVHFANKKLSQYYDIDENISNEGNLKEMLLYLFQMYNFKI